MNRKQQETQQPSVDFFKSQELVSVTSEVKEIQANSTSSTQIYSNQEESTGGYGPQIQLAEKEEADSRSVYVGNVDYCCTAEEVQEHFSSCGIINRVTILVDIYGNPKGYAYVEFDEKEAVQNALLLNESELRGRHLRVAAKRTNVPGMGRGGWATPYYGFRHPAYYSSYRQYPWTGRYRPY